MLMLSRLPITEATYTRLPTHQARDFLRADILINGIPQVVCCVHLDSGKSSSGYARGSCTRYFARCRQRKRCAPGDFNMRDDENARIAAPFYYVWPALLPYDDGFTEDTSINLMRFDMKNKHRQVRFDRVLIKGPHWTAVEIELLGMESISGEYPRVFPSDHFGVECRLIRL